MKMSNERDKWKTCRECKREVCETTCQKLRDEANEVTKGMEMKLLKHYAMHDGVLELFRALNSDYIDHLNLTEDTVLTTDLVGDVIDTLLGYMNAFQTTICDNARKDHGQCVQIKNLKRELGEQKEVVKELKQRLRKTE